MKKIGRTIRRRRKEGKTDYKLRIGMLKSGMPRLVVRKTNKYLIAQIVQSDIAQDKIISGASSKDLLSLGWPEKLSGSLKSIEASYLLGLLLAKKAKIKSAIIDMGLQRNIHKGRIYAVVKGAIDGGIKINCNEESVLNEDQINKNEKLLEIFNKVKGEISKK